MLRIPADEMRRREEYAAFLSSLQSAQIELERLRSHLSDRLCKLAPANRRSQEQAKEETAKPELRGHPVERWVLFVRVILCLATLAALVAFVAAVYYERFTTPSPAS